MEEKFWDKIKVVGGSEEQNKKIKEFLKQQVESGEIYKKPDYDLRAMKINQYKRYVAKINPAFRLVQQAIASNFEIIKAKAEETKFQTFIKVCIFNQNTLSSMYKKNILDEALNMGALSKSKYSAIIDYINYDFEAGERNPEDLKIILNNCVNLYFKRSK